MTDNQEKFMNPYTDFGFKKLFGTEPNKDILISFLNAVFQGKRPSITDIRYINTEVLEPYYGSRNSVFDIYCLTEDGGQFIVEMQRSDQPYFKDRTVYYAASAIVQQAPKGEWDYQLEDVCVVGILNFVFPNNEYGKDSFYHEVKLNDTEDNHTVYKKLAFYYLEMPKFNKTEDELDTMFDKWLFVIKNICYLMEKPKQLQEQVFTKFFEQARIAMFTPEEQFAYQESRKQYWDNRNTIAYSFEKGKESGIAEGKELGIAEGRAEGRAETNLENAQKMRDAGIDRKIILEITGVDVDGNSECGIRNKPI